MGIDIRDGQQLACITCALCIDACDDVMDKIGKPRGLIDYIALTDETRERAGKEPRSIWKHIFRPRTILYTVLWSAVGIGLTAALFMRQEIDLTVAPVRNPVFVTLSDGSIRNTYDVRLRNMNLDDRDFQLSLWRAATVSSSTFPRTRWCSSASMSSRRRARMPREPTGPSSVSGSRTF
jgi:polyferredoxin